MRRLALLFAIAAFLFGHAMPSALAQQPGTAARAAAGQAATPSKTVQQLLDKWDAETKLVEVRLDSGEVSIEEIDSMRAVLEAQRAAIPAHIQAVETELKPLRDQLDALGPPPEDADSEAREITEQRATLTERIGEIEARLKRLAQAEARAQGLLARLALLRRQIFTRQLLTRGPSPLSPEALTVALQSMREITGDVIAESAERLAAENIGAHLLLRVLLPTLLVGAALFLVVAVKGRALDRLLVAPVSSMTPARRVWTAIALTLVRLLVPSLALVLVLLGLWNSGLLGDKGAELVRGAAWGTMIVIGAYAIGAAWYAPHAPGLRLSRLPEHEAVAAHRWLMALAAVIALDQVVVKKGYAIGLSLEALALLNLVLLVFGGAALWALAGHLTAPAQLREATAASGEGLAEAEAGSGASAPEHDEGLPALAAMSLSARLTLLTARLVAVVAPLLALAGYLGASRYVFYPPVFSGGVIGLGLVLFHGVETAVDQLAAGPTEKETERRPSRIRLIPVAVGFLLIVAAVPVLALVWGADLTDLSSAWISFSEGFRIGDVRVSPLDFFVFLVVFFIGYVLTRVIEGILARSVLPVTGLDVGAREAIRTGVFYVGVVISALVAVSATGIDLSNLAIVVGALSVGIGFGLQNVVNNFVSGLILLIERPVTVGDWIELPAGSGYVKRIRVRSTEIETFDRASLIVPNSQLISETVTNWTHENHLGRLIVPIGVAYGTDPRKVEEILLEIAKAHPMLLRRPAPYVLFRRFGADALEFEIRGILRDVNFILSVGSDINYEIARRFAEEGIEIPFAQRDIHIRSTGDLGRAIGEGLTAAREGGDDDGSSGAEATKRSPRHGPPPRDVGGEEDGDGDGGDGGGAGDAR